MPCLKVFDASVQMREMVSIMSSDGIVRRA